GKTLYRFSGSVLMMIIAGGGVEQVRELMKIVTDRFAGSWKIGDDEHFLSMSAGAALYPDDSSNCEGLYRCSTLAMYRAAEEERNTYIFYSKELEERAGAVFNAEQRLRRAVLNDMEGFSVSYMPIADTEGNINALEAVVSWVDRENGKMPAGRVIKLAESIGIDELIDSWVINNACAFLREVIDMTGCEGLVMNINLTSHELRRSSVYDTVRSAAETFGLKANNIAVEIPEKAQLKIENNFGVALNEFKNAGVRVVIDDFGREYMSLTALKSGMSDVIKIRAEQFCGGDEFDKAALKSVIMLAHNRGISVCVKHIETKEQYETAKAFFVDHLQGSYLFPCSDEDSIKRICSEFNTSVAVPKWQ
ncbi:MAG: GGDEF domain-containing phosphodiesterase, partial [Ruminiclostridium sp.]|nr:GGDEF domain-containing phosphodiesterase [Ruminiclostridium sp.]